LIAEQAGRPVSALGLPIRDLCRYSAQLARMIAVAFMAFAPLKSTAE